MPVSYMGSKRVVGQYIYRAIANREPKGILVDLFCGGLAVGELFLNNGWNVLANDKNKYIIALIRAVIERDSEYTKEVERPRFYTREDFFDVIEKPDNYPDWQVGYVQSIWSFGNKGDNYIFSRDIEAYKYAGHLLAVNNDDTEMRKMFGNKIPEKYYRGIKSLDDWHKRRIALARVSKKLCDMVSGIRPLKQLQSLERLKQLEHLARLERLQHLERLERPEQIERSPRLALYSTDYRDMLIPKNAVIYCDPPYSGTAEYVCGEFDSKAFWDWAEKKAKSQPVYVSEYSAPENWEEIITIPRRSNLQGGNGAFVGEKLFKLKGGK